MSREGRGGLVERKKSESRRLESVQALMVLTGIGFGSGDPRVFQVCTAIQRWVAVDGDLEEILGLRPGPGSTLTGPKLYRHRRLFDLLTQLAVMTDDNVALMARFLRPNALPNSRIGTIVEELHRLKCPASETSIRRILKRFRRINGGCDV